MIIIPTVLEKDFYKAEARISQVRDFSRWIQVDVTDNVYTPGKSFELELVNKIDFPTENILWDIHLMVKEPVGWINKCVFVGASRIIGQVEMMSDKEAFVKSVKDVGVEAGLAFDIETDIDSIPDETDVVIIMGRKAGYETGIFQKDILKKIEILRQAQDKREKKFLIAVDGGVGLDNLDYLSEAGVDIIYSGNNYLKLNNAIKSN